MSVLSPQEVARFHQDGYLRFRRVIDADQVQRLRDELERLRAEERSGRHTGERPPEFAYGHDRDSEPMKRPDRAIHQFVNMWKVSPAYREVLDNPLITGAVRELMNAERVRLWHDQVISKPPGDNAKFRCHHDFYFWPLDRPRMISCWLALDRATPDNGCMHVVPGSHRDPRYQPADCDLSAEIGLEPRPLGPGEPGSLYDEIRQIDQRDTKPVLLDAGECMFHHCLNWHFTPANVTDRQRRALVLIFMPDGTRYKHAQSPTHICTSYLNLEDGAKMQGENFPVCG